MIFNREEECTEDEKEYYDIIGICTAVLSGIFLLMILSNLFNNYPKFNTIYLFIISGAFIACNIILSVNIRDTLKKVWLTHKVLLMFIFTPSILYSLITLWFTLVLFFTQEAINPSLRIMLYILCSINIIILLSIWIFGPCNKIDHDCNVESWPDKFKTDALKPGREDFCNNLNETCMDDKNKSGDECGSCSDTTYSNEDDCTDNNGEWTSRYTKCFWSQGSNKKVSSCDITTDSPSLEVHGGSCVYDLDKCASINCDDFQPTSVFYDCCEENTLGWEENMDCDTLRSQIEANKTNEGKIGEGSQRAGELEAEYNLRVAASSQTSNIHNQDLYE